MNRQEALKRVGFLRSVPESVRAEIGRAGYERRLEPGETIFLEKEPCCGLLVVLNGVVKVYKVDARGREMTLFVERSGSSVLDLPLFDGGNYPANAAACEKDTLLYIVPPERFHALLGNYPEITVAAVRHLAIQMRKLIEMLKVQALHTVRSRLAAYLLNTAGTERIFPLNETNEAIGSQVGTVREVISRTLAAFETEGIILRQGRRIILLDREHLRQIAEDAS